MDDLCTKCGQKPITLFKGYKGLDMCYQCCREWTREKKKDEKARAEKEAKRKPPEEPAKSQPVDMDDHRWMPPYMRWCALNPTLSIHAEDMTEEDKKKERRYINGEGGKPTKLARNYYKMVKGNPRALERMYDKVNTLYATHIKKRESRAQEEDAKQIDDIAKLIKRHIKPKGYIHQLRKRGDLPQRRENKK